LHLLFFVLGKRRDSIITNGSWRVRQALPLLSPPSQGGVILTITTNS